MITSKYFGFLRNMVSKDFHIFSQVLDNHYFRL